MRTLTKKPSRYNPHGIRRCVRQMAETPDGTLIFVVKSMTRIDGTVHQPAIDLGTGECDCTCEHFVYRLKPDAMRNRETPCLKSPQYLCKHIRKCLLNLERKGVMLPPSMERDFESETVARIPLKPAGYALVDAEDYEWLSQWNWRLHTNGYAFRLQRDNYYQHPIYMHRLLCGTSGAQETDHINRNRLDNRRSNLREATSAQNKANRLKSVHNTSGYKGVSPTRNQRQWRAEIRADGVSKRLGQFDDPAEAARAYDRAALRMHGRFAAFNFPDEMRRALNDLARRGELPQQNGRFAAPCIHCDGDGEYEVCDERTGEVLPGQFICGDCINARMDDLRDAAPVASSAPVFSAPVEAKPDYSDPAVREAIFAASEDW